MFILFIILNYIINTKTMWIAHKYIYSQQDLGRCVDIDKLFVCIQMCRM